MDRLAEQAEAKINALSTHQSYGEVTKILGLLVEIAGFGSSLSIGSICHLRPNDQTNIPCEVVGFKDGHALLMPFGTLEGVGLGCRAYIQDTPPTITPDDRWLGRVINGMAEPIDGLGPLYQGDAQEFDVVFKPVKKGLFPIPQTEVDISNGVYKQNTGY